jgi:hypothetical protein
MPALILTYSGIDALGWLAAPDITRPVRERFTSWVDTSMLPAKPLGCTAIELYSARCGILHTMTADSHLSARDGVRRIAYAWGGGNATELPRLADRVSRGQIVAVHISDLAEALRLGTALMFERAERDAELNARITERGNRFFSSIGIDEFRTAVRDATDAAATSRGAEADARVAPASCRPLRSL